MVRRRSASPRSSVPVHAPSRAAAPPSRAPPARAPAGAPPGAAPPSQGPGLMGQMMATAGGVAIGSALGHAVGNMFTGGRENEAVPQQQQQDVPMAKQYERQQAQVNPCEWEWRQFMDCTQNANDLSVCQAYNDIFKQCKTKQERQGQF